MTEKDFLREYNSDNSYEITKYNSCARDYDKENDIINIFLTDKYGYGYCYDGVTGKVFELTMPKPSEITNRQIALLILWNNEDELLANKLHKFALMTNREKDENGLPNGNLYALLCWQDDEFEFSSAEILSVDKKIKQQVEEIYNDVFSVHSDEYGNALIDEIVKEYKEKYDDDDTQINDVLLFPNLRKAVTDVIYKHIDGLSEYDLKNISGAVVTLYDELKEIVDVKEIKQWD